MEDTRICYACGEEVMIQDMVYTAGDFYICANVDCLTEAVNNLFSELQQLYLK